MKVFISGPMSGKPNSNKEAFFKAQGELMSHGYSVWNPAWFVDHCAVAEFSKDALQAISNEVLRHCDAIYMLKGWMHSEGAWNEHEIAEARELVIMYEGKCCWDKEPEDEHDVLKRHIKTVEEALAWERWKNKLPDSLDSKKIDSLEKWRNDFAECYTVNITNLRKEVEAIKESIGTDNLQEQLENDFSDVYEEFRNTKDQVNDINMGYIKWSSEVSQFDERIEKLEENMKEIAANGGLRLSFNLMNERINSNKRDISSLRNDIDDYKEAYKHLDNADEALERRIKALENSVSDIRHIVNSSDIENISIKAMNDRMNRFDRKLDQLNTAIDICGKDIGTIVQKRCDDNRTINNTLNDLNVRLKAIEKRLSIKPFYEPTEDEKNDD